MNQKEIQKIADKTWKRKYKIGGANPFYSMGFSDAEEVAKIISSRRVVMKSLPTDRQIEALFEARDMIENAVDGAKDRKYWNGLLKRLNTLWKKLKKLKREVGNVS